MPDDVRITVEALPPGGVYALHCGLSPTSLPVSARVVADDAIATVVLHWQLATGGSGSSALRLDGTRWVGTIGPFAAAGDVAWWVVATTELGAYGSTAERTLRVHTCNG